MNTIRFFTPCAIFIALMYSCGSTEPSQTVPTTHVESAKAMADTTPPATVYYNTDSTWHLELAPCSAMPPDFTADPVPPQRTMFWRINVVPGPDVPLQQRQLGEPDLYSRLPFRPQMTVYDSATTVATSDPFVDMGDCAAGISSTSFLFPKDAFNRFKGNVAVTIEIKMGGRIILPVADKPHLQFYDVPIRALMQNFEPPRTTDSTQLADSAWLMRSGIPQFLPQTIH